MLCDNGVVSEDYLDIKNATIKYYSNLFSDEDGVQDASLSIPFKRVLNERGRTFLDAAITLEELEEAMFVGDPNKAPGPDGLTNAFFQKAWNIIKLDL